MRERIFRRFGARALERFSRRLRRFREILNCFAAARKFLGVRQPFQNRFAVGFFSDEERGELPLREHRHARKLIKVQPDGFENFLPDVLAGNFRAVVFATQRPFRLAKISGARAPEREFCAIGFSVVPVENEFAVARVFRRNSEPRVLFDGVDSDFDSRRIVAKFVVRFVHHVFDARRRFVERERDCVENCGFSGAGFARDEKHLRGSTGRGVGEIFFEIDVRLANRSDVANVKFSDFHGVRDAKKF